MAGERQAMMERGREESLLARGPAECGCFAVLGHYLCLERQGTTPLVAR